MAITALLLVIAALLTRSFIAAQRTNPGFAINSLAVVSTDTSTLKLTPVQTQRFWDTAIEKISRDPRRRVGRARDPGADAGQPEQLGDLGSRASSSRRTRRHRGSDDRLARLLQDDGRGDRRGARVHRRRSTRHAARRDRQRNAGATASGRARAQSARSFTLAAARGRRSRSSASPPITRSRRSSEPPTPFLQIPRAQRPGPYTAVIARTRGDSAALLQDMRRALLAIDPNVVFIENQTMEMQSRCDAVSDARQRVAGERGRSGGDAAGGDRSLRRDRLLGSATDPGNRHPRRARCAARRGGRAGDAARAAGRRWPA